MVHTCCAVNLLIPMSVNCLITTRSSSTSCPHTEHTRTILTSHPLSYCAHHPPSRSGRPGHHSQSSSRCGSARSNTQSSCACTQTCTCSPLAKLDHNVSVEPAIVALGGIVLAFTCLMGGLSTLGGGGIGLASTCRNMPQTLV